MSGRFASGVGVVSSLGCILLWLVFLFFNPYNRAIPGATQVLGAFMIGVSALGALAAYKKQPWPMYVLFLALFVPVGLYVLLTPGVFMLIGIFDLLFLGSALLLHRAPPC
jgi:hypothetical protein